jgi:hypothetical protein
MQMAAILGGTLGISLTLALAILTGVLVEIPLRHLRDWVSWPARDFFGRALAAWTLVAIAGGLILFCYGFISGWVFYTGD